MAEQGRIRVSNKILPEAPWIEVYKGFFVLKLDQGSLVRIGEALAYVPNGSSNGIYPVEWPVKLAWAEGETGIIKAK